MVDQPTDGDTRFCYSCGSRLSPEAQYCEQCGADQRGAAVPQTTHGQSQSGADGQNGSSLYSVVKILALVAASIGLILLFLYAVLVIFTVTIFSNLGGIHEVSPDPHFDYQQEGRTLNVSVASGSFDGDTVHFEGDIEADGKTWRELTGDQDVSHGDSVSLSVPTEEYAVDIVWESGDGDRRVLDTYSPEAESS